jgi:hypothetical protein
MNVNLGTVCDKFIVELLRLAELRKEIAIGCEQADRGEFVSGEQTFADIRRRSAARKRPRG